jgi:NAD(P)H-hydrate epimerase
VSGLLELQIPTVIDADGLNNLADFPNWPQLCGPNVVLTPHPGEMRRLTAGLSLSVDLNDRQEWSCALSQACRSVIVLKGHRTVVSDPDRVYVNRTGNPGMATGGTGDVLTGVIAALIVQGLTAFEAAVLGAHVHGLAGDIAADRRGQVGMIASDLLDTLPDAFLSVDAGRSTP